MPSDRSRSTDRTRHGYTGVAAQQGRVVLDRDFNAQQGLTADRIAADALDFVGPCGTPDDGFRISPTGGSPPTTPFWSPPVSVPSSPPETPGGAGDFLIAPGTIYLGGERVYWPGEQNGGPITYSYFDQPDWPAPAAPPSPSANLPRELVYLEATELEVSAVEDPDLLEVALGGPDTTQRLKLLRRVRRMPVSAKDCAPAWKTAVDQWAAAGWQFDPETMRLLPQVRLQIGFTEPASDNNLCDPVATGGYLGNENQMIRLRIAGSGFRTQLIWGYDNASFLYRVATVSSDLTTLTLAADPPDGFHIPQTGQLVEVLRTGAVLGQEPDETDPFGQTQILRVAADIHGSLRHLKQPYGPIPGGTANVIVLTEALPSDINGSGLPLFLRVWQAAQSISPSGGTYTLQQSVTDPNSGVTSTILDTGLTATVSVPAGATLADGAFWQIAVRPSTPQGVYPEDLLIAPQLPDGLRRWVCPLAVIDGSVDGQPHVTDCRNCFDNLVTLCRRKPGCCTVAIGPGDVTAAATLQTLIDRAAALATVMGQPATVCLSPGDYALPASLYLDPRHNGLTLESCGGPAVLHAVTNPNPALFADGLMVLNEAAGVTLRGLTLHAPVVEAPIALFEDALARLKKDGFDQAAQLFRRPNTSIGVRAVNARSLTLEDCTIVLASDAGPVTADLFGAAVFLQGFCLFPTVRGCRLGSAVPPTYTRLAVAVGNAPPTALEVFNHFLALLATPESSPPLSSPPSSPPASAAVLLDRKASAALDSVLAKRFASGSIIPSFVVVTVGVLAADTIKLGCVFNGAAVRDSDFAQLTFATWFSATTNALRLQGNSVSAGVAGLWLEVPGAADPVSGAVEGTDIFYNRVRLFEEYQLLVALASIFPPLSQSAGRAITAGSSDARFQPEFSLYLTGNQVETRLPSASAGASAALLLALYSEPPAVQPVSSVIVSANRLYGGMASFRIQDAQVVPAALLTLPWGLPCSITGNVILNRGLAGSTSSDEIGPSLWLTVANGADGTRLLSVTGNVLWGLSDLARLIRPGVTVPPGGWHFYNADPT